MHQYFEVEDKNGNHVTIRPDMVKLLQQNGETTTIVLHPNVAIHVNEAYSAVRGRMDTAMSNYLLLNR